MLQSQYYSNNFQLTSLTLVTQSHLVDKTCAIR